MYVHILFIVLCMLCCRFTVTTFSFLDPIGVPDFWLTVFKNADLLTDMVKVC